MQRSAVHSISQPEEQQKKLSATSRFQHDFTQLPISTGKPMPEAVQQKMEAAFGTGFSDVRIHEGAQAAAINAIAYTQANHIHFQPGEYNPTSPKGQALLGHELAHVLQQRQGRVKRTMQAEGLPINDENALEQEAELAAQRVTQNQAIGSSHAQPATSPTQIGVAQRYKTDDKKEKNKFIKGATESESVFRARMATEMQTLQQTVKNKNQNPDPLEKGDLSQLPFDFYAKQRNEREAELEQLRKGTLKGGRELTSQKDISLKTAIDTAQAGPSVTSGATRSNAQFGKTPGSKIRTLSGGKISALETKLNNPNAYPTPIPSNPLKAQPLLGIADRQKDILKGAKEADPLMKDILTHGNLSRSHFGTKAAQNPYLFSQNNPIPVPGQSQWNASGNLAKTATPTQNVYSYGMEEFGNQEKRLPTITNHPVTVAPSNSGATARLGRYSEADLTPRQKDPANNKAQNRDARRLVYSGTGTEIADNSKAISQGVNVPTTTLSEPSFNLTTDHYTSFVPITPVQKPLLSSPKYAHPENRGNSLKYQDEQRLTQVAEQAKLSSGARSQKEDTRVDALRSTLGSTETTLREDAEKAALAASQKTNERQAALAKADDEAENERLRQEAREELEESIYGNAGL